MVFVDVRYYDCFVVICLVFLVCCVSLVLFVVISCVCFGFVICTCMLLLLGVVAWLGGWFMGFTVCCDCVLRGCLLYGCTIWLPCLLGACAVWGLLPVYVSGSGWFGFTCGGC